MSLYRRAVSHALYMASMLKYVGLQVARCMGHKDRIHASQGIVKVHVLQHSTSCLILQLIARHIPVNDVVTKLVCKCLR
jgi:hypothetical protein